jgi:hypothetical protein
MVGSSYQFRLWTSKQDDHDHHVEEDDDCDDNDDDDDEGIGVWKAPLWENKFYMLESFVFLSLHLLEEIKTLIKSASSESQ